MADRELRFILPSGNTLYFWFTPDVHVPPEKQILDGVTGIYVSHKSNDAWSMPERVRLQEQNKLSLDGAVFVDDDVIWFCSAREGYMGPEYSGGLSWFKAQFDITSKKWANWRLVDFPVALAVGELHIHESMLYFHSARPGGKGCLDIWVVETDNEGKWQEPQNVEHVNTERDEGWPAISPNGDELWITRDYALWRSVKINGEWTNPEKIISPLAAEASIDKYGNVYFIHHYFEDNIMIEADIYVAYKK